MNADDVHKLVELTGQITKLLHNADRYPAAKLIVAISLAASLDVSTEPIREHISQWFHENVDVKTEGRTTSATRAWPDELDI